MAIEILNSFEKRAALGGLVGNETAMGKVDKAAQFIVDNSLLNPQKTADKAAVVSRATYLVNTLAEQGEFKTESVESLQAVLVDSQKTEKQKEIARNRIDELSASVFIAMRYGSDDVLRDRLGEGPKAVEDILPKPLKGLGERVVGHIISDEKILKTLKDLDIKRVRAESAGESGVKVLTKKMQETMEALVDMEVGPWGEEEIKLVMSYLGAEMLNIEVVVDGDRQAEERKKGGSGDITSVIEALETSGERSESTFDTFVNAEFIQQPIQLQLDTFPPSWFRKPPERFLKKKEHNTVADWQQMIRARVNLTNASYIKAKVAALNGEEAKDNQFLVLSERELGLIYNEPGVSWVAERVVADFFEKDDSDSVGYFLALKEGNVGEKKWKDVLASFRKYQEELVQKLIKRDDMSEIDAKGAVAMAWNFLYVCNVFESADNNRDIGGNCGNIFGEQIRAMMHPLSKAKRKFGVQPDLDANSRAEGTEEGWGGLVGGWFADMVSWSDTRPKFVKGLQEGTIVPFPKRIGASMVEIQEVEVYDRPGHTKTMSMAQALIEKRKIKFGETDSNLFGDYGDKWDTFFKFYQYAVGKTPLDTKKFREWTNNLSDVLAKIRSIKVRGDEGKLFPDLDNANTMAWIIANSIGLHRSERLMITVPKGLNYEAFVDTILQSPRLVMDQEKRKDIKDKLHARMTQTGVRAGIELEANRRNARKPEKLGS